MRARRLFAALSLLLACGPASAQTAPQTEAASIIDAMEDLCWRQFERLSGPEAAARASAAGWSESWPYSYTKSGDWGSTRVGLAFQPEGSCVITVNPTPDARATAEVIARLETWITARLDHPRKRVTDRRYPFGSQAPWRHTSWTGDGMKLSAFEFRQPDGSVQLNVWWTPEAQGWPE